MLELKRIGDEVYYKDKKLTIIKQETKGPGKEVVKIEGLHPYGRKWISLSKLVEGLNVLNENDLKGVERGKDYELTEEETKQVQEYQAKIDEIIENAKKRYVKPIKVVTLSNIKNMDQEQLQNYIKFCQEQLEKLKG